MFTRLVGRFRYQILNSIERHGTQFQRVYLYLFRDIRKTVDKLITEMGCSTNVQHKDAPETAEDYPYSKSSPKLHASMLLLPNLKHLRRNLVVILIGHGRAIHHAV